MSANSATEARMLPATPVSVNNLNNVFAVYAGEETPAPFYLSGGVVCWGGNYTGQLGIGTTAGPEFCTYPGPNPLDPPITEPCSTVPVQVVRGAASAVVWSSANLPAATIDNRGLATGLGNGLSIITAALGPLSGNTTLTVGSVRVFLPIIFNGITINQLPSGKPGGLPTGGPSKAGVDGMFLLSSKVSFHVTGKKKPGPGASRRASDSHGFGSSPGMTAMHFSGSFSEQPELYSRNCQIFGVSWKAGEFTEGTSLKFAKDWYRY